MIDLQAEFKQDEKKDKVFMLQRVKLDELKNESRKEFISNLVNRNRGKRITVLHKNAKDSSVT